MGKRQPALKKIRVALALVFFTGITLLFLDVTGVLHLYLGWMARLQLLPAILAGNAVVVAALALLTLLFGRIYCSMICPLGVMQDVVIRLRARHGRRHKTAKHFSFKAENKWLRYGIFTVFAIALMAGVHVIVALLAPYSTYGRMVQNLLGPVADGLNNLLAWVSARTGSYAFYGREVWIRSLPTFTIAAASLVLIVFLALRGGRSWCNNVCPVGTLLGFLSRISIFRPVIDKDKCRNCHACERVCKASCIDISEHRIDHSRCVDCFNCLGSCNFDALHYKFAYGRHSSVAPDTTADGETSARHDGDINTGRRSFLGGAALLAAASLKAEDLKVDGGLAPLKPKRAPRRSTPLTPPGSRSVDDFYSRCTACQLCVSECPNSVLRPSTELQRLMQPEMYYERGFCRPECTRCSEVCPTGAISLIDKTQKTEYHIGKASVRRCCCLAEKGVSCGLCATRCPVGAIVMVPIDPEDGNSPRRPSVLEDLCIGCGACEHYCPVSPVSAITVNGRPEHLKS